MKEEEKIEVRSDEVQEILSHVPNWMIRWGTTLFLSLILLIVFLSWFIKYPDVVQGGLSLTTNQPPSRLVSQTNGYIEHLLIQNESVVKRGEIIAEMRSPIRKGSIDSLFTILEENNNQKMIEELSGLSDLGVLQNEINALVNSLIEYENVNTNDYFKNSVQNLSSQIDYNNRLATITKQELDLLTVEITNAKEKFEADSILYSKAVIAKHTFYSNQSQFFLKRQQFIAVKKAYVQYRITSTNYEKQKIDLQKSYEDQKRQLKTAIDASKKSIRSSIANWQQNFVLEAPIDGKLSYLSNISEQQYVPLGRALFAIIPEGENIVGIIKISGQAFGKVQLHQKVTMKFNNYPYQEFGQLLGTVSEISKIPSEQGYFVRVLLTNGLTTTYNKRIEYKPEMTGIAEVVTDDLRLIERVFINFRKVLDQ